MIDERNPDEFTDEDWRQARKRWVQKIMCLQRRLLIMPT
jgi:hypothetical protein